MSLHPFIATVYTEEYVNKESVGSERGVQGVEEDYLRLVNGGEKSGALYVSVTRYGLILLCLYILHSLICSTNYNYLHSNPTLPWPILHLSLSTFFSVCVCVLCERACSHARLCSNSV